MSSSDTLAARPRRVTAAAVIALAVCMAACSTSRGALPAAAQEIVDDFASIAPWQAAASDGANASLHPATGPTGAALRLDFDLGGTAGYAAARRTLALDLPPNYELSFYLRADAPVNDLQVKLIDASGDNVWWFRRPDFEFPRQWQLIRIKKRQVEFAWGPAADHTLRHVAAIEFVVSAGRGGGSGSVFISELALRELPRDSGIVPAPSAQASSFLPGAEPALALDGDPATAWESDPATGKTQNLTIDLGQAREFGGLVLRWRPGAFASRYDVLLSDDGEHWHTVRSVTAGRGGSDALRLADAQARFVRLALLDGPGDGYGLSEVEVRDLAFGATPNAFVAALAREAPRGTYPRGFSGEQAYWTLVGIDGGSETGLLSEDGALEVGRGGFSIEPFVISGTRVVTWADVDSQPFLAAGYLPLPGVRWLDPRWELRVTAFAAGVRARSRLIARYELINRTADRLTVTLALTARPFQVNPPRQFLGVAGGVSAIDDVAWDGAALVVNGVRRVFPLQAPDRFGAFPSEAGPLPAVLAGNWSNARAVHDETGLASAVLAYHVSLAPHARARIGIAVPLSGPATAPALGGMSVSRWLEREERTVAATWRQKLDRVRFRVPNEGQPLVDTMRTALAHVLISRDGPILRPGTRAYARSWIRDGTMISESLLRLGHGAIAADYLRWYAPYQFANGKIPCCVDARGADPVQENDSPGEFIFLAGEVYRYGHDRALLEAMWPHVEGAARYLETLRQTGRTAANLEPASRAFYGILPASISHEGYAAKPVHSYWDDFWAVKGYDSAYAMALALGRDESASSILAQGDEFRRDLAASLAAATAAHRIAYLPGSAELGDFDPTSTSVAFAPRGDPQDLPGEMVRATYERYWREFERRRDGRSDWDDYTPYELRNVATFVRLGWRDRAADLLTFLLTGRRPAAWNQWAEVVGRDPRQPRFVGDMPHAWVAADFINSFLDLFAYERGADRALVLGAGIPPAWLHGRGISVAGLRTSYGRLSYALRVNGSRTVLQVPAGPRIPPGGLVFVWPGTQPARQAWLNGRRISAQDGELRIGELPARVVIEQ
jgi:F5/8 type C domain-containing protein